MFNYETGIVVALLLWLYNAVMIVVSVNSQFERNLNRIGQRLSWLTLTPKPMEQEDLARSAWSRVLRYLLIVGIGLPFILLSWLNVALAAAIMIYRYSKDRGAPSSDSRVALAHEKRRYAVRSTRERVDESIGRRSIQI